MSERMGRPESRERISAPLVISGFPGIGESTLFENSGVCSYSDSDSTNFSWKDSSKQQRNPEWPKNYIDHIRSSTSKNDALFVSTHKETRDALKSSGVPFVLVYPSLEMKEEYIQRYIDRGSDEKFIELLRNNYESWVTELMTQEGCKHVVLKPGQYLSDVMEQIRT